MSKRDLVLCVLMVWLTLATSLGGAFAHGETNSGNPAVGHEEAAPKFSEFDERQALAYSQAAIGREVGDYRFIASDGRTVRLSQYRGKPLVISLIYTSCYHTCPMITQALSRSARAAGNALGVDSFSIVTIGFDTAVDTPARMRQYGKEQGANHRSWTLLSTDADTMAKLAKDLGFIFYASPKGYDHLAQTTILSSDGKVATQVYGADFEPPMVVDPLKRLIFGGNANLTSVDGLIGRVRLICTIYDPKSERYHFDYSLLVGIIVGGLCLTLVAVVLVREAWLLRKYTKKRRESGST